jgi:hypothetical protein
VSCEDTIVAQPDRDVETPLIMMAEGHANRLQKAVQEPLAYWSVGELTVTLIRHLPGGIAA